MTSKKKEVNEKRRMSKKKREKRLFWGAGMVDWCTFLSVRCRRILLYASRVYGFLMQFNSLDGVSLI